MFNVVRILHMGGSHTRSECIFVAFKEIIITNWPIISLKRTNKILEDIPRNTLAVVTTMAPKDLGYVRWQNVIFCKILQLWYFRWQTETPLQIDRFDCYRKPLKSWVTWPKVIHSTRQPKWNQFSVLRLRKSSNFVKFVVCAILPLVKQIAIVLWFFGPLKNSYTAMGRMTTNHRP